MLQFDNLTVTQILHELILIKKDKNYIFDNFVCSIFPNSNSDLLKLISRKLIVAEKFVFCHTGLMLLFIFLFSNFSGQQVFVAFGNFWEKLFYY